jgi:hypothetical protein
MNTAKTVQTNTGHTTETSCCQPRNNGKEQAEPITVCTAIPNLAESLKYNTHHCRRIGMLDTSTTYYSSWQSKLNVIDETHRHMFMTSSKVTPTQRKMCGAVLLWTTAHQQTAVPIQKGEKHSMSPVQWSGRCMAITL